MKLFTQKQKTWLVRKKIQVGDFYSFPSMGFTIYVQPNYLMGEHIDTNPMTKSLAHEHFLVKEITDNGFCRGNFYGRPKGSDMYLTEEELSRRELIEIFILFIFCAIPMIIYNLFKDGVKKIEGAEQQPSEPLKNNNLNKSCGSCKYFNQDLNCCRCFNPKQTDKELISYCYHSFSCDLFEEGKRLSDEEMDELGFLKRWRDVKYASEEVGGYFYYEKK